jgi:transcription initiation factor TFIIIB Brf1 subunit/transcription initiation factor TFIIB
MLLPFEVQLAIDRNFTRGRRTTHVAAACLYIACPYATTAQLLNGTSETFFCVLLT